MNPQPMHHFHFCLFFPVDRGSHAVHGFVAQRGLGERGQGVGDGMDSLLDGLNEGLAA